MLVLSMEEAVETVELVNPGNTGSSELHLELVLTYPNSAFGFGTTFGAGGSGGTGGNPGTPMTAGKLEPY
jgi:hypothetical protein